MDMSWATPQLAMVCMSIALMRTDWPLSWHDVSACLSLIAGVATLAELGQFRSISATWTPVDGNEFVVVSYARARVQMIPVDPQGRPVEHAAADMITRVRIHDVSGSESRSALAVSR